MAKRVVQPSGPTAIRDAPRIYVPSAKQIMGPRQSIPRPGLPSPPGTFEYPASTPVHLTAYTTLASNSSGGVNAIALKNPNGTPMEVLEIKFQLRTNSAAALDANLGGTVACKLGLGNYPLTNGFVPVWSFGRRECELEVSSNATPTFEQAMEYTWRLAKPLYVPAGAVILPTFQHRGVVQNDITVRISYSGRSLDPSAPPPAKLALPYVAQWVSKSFAISTTPDSDQSTETDLVNPFSEPLLLQRFVGRCQIFRSDTSSLSEDDLARVSYRLCNLRMIDMFGRPILRNYTPFRMVFDALSRSWEMDNCSVLDPRSYIIAYLRADPAGDNNMQAQFSYQTFVSLIGWRDVVGGAP